MQRLSHQLAFVFFAFFLFAGLRANERSDNSGRLEVNGSTRTGAAQQPGGTSPKPFPTVGILPKREVGALRFLEQFPEYDGRGVVVAIFDNGVDPGAPGLQITTGGQPKIIDMIDGTGSGDVDTSTVRETKNQTLTGLTGRTLKVPTSWKNPAGRYHVGMKSAYSFFPGGLISRLKRQRRKRWDAEHHKTQAALRRQIVAWDAKHKNPKTDEKQQRADLKTRLEQLAEAEKQYDDPGPVYDCVVFHDGCCWWAVIDTDEDGDLDDEKLLRNFRAEHEWATFDDDSLLNFAVNIFDEGNRLSIVAGAGAHGTHVAGIVAAHFPDQPELNGIAPGAQIVSVKIGDSRLGSMETGAGLERGLRAVVENDCDLINMSYGEPTSTPDRGRLIRLFSDLVSRHGVIFVASAGNDGPALSTVGAPGGTTSAILGVGAYVSPEMMAAEYSLRQKLPGMPYTWTSRGPTFDGDLGVDLFAPGGAIAPVPNWTLQRSMRMNGTSMASPNACGAMALLLSGMKATKTPYSPYSIRRAVQNTARTIDGADVFAQGAGLLQVDRAFDHLQKFARTLGERQRFSVELQGRRGSRGLYLREHGETDRPTEATVRLRPIFDDDGEKRSRVDFELRLSLQTSQPWVETGDHLLLTHGGGTFQIHVDPTALKPGVHFTEVCGYDADLPDRGPLFRVPVTVIRPRQPLDGSSAEFSERLQFVPGQIERRFLSVPDGATWADLSLRSTTTAAEGRTFVVHTVQMIPGETYEALSKRQFVRLRRGEETVRSFRVAGGRTLELCLAQYWSSLGSSKLEYQLTFHGLLPDSRELTLSEAQPITRVVVSAPIRREQLSPTAVLKTHRTFIRPAQAEIQPLNPLRDVLPDGRQIYELQLTYKFSQERAGTVTPRFSRNDGLLYDSSFGTQLWSIFDSGKRRVVTDDVYPSPVRLGKGDHVLKLQLRHTDVAKLEAMKTMPLSLDRPLSGSISLGVYPSRAAALAGAARFSPQSLQRGRRVSLSVAAPDSLPFPPQAVPGDLLLGSISYGKGDESRHGAGRRPGGFPIQYVVGKRRTKTANSVGTATIPASVLDFKTAQLKKLITAADSDRFDELAQEILGEHPNHFPVLVAKLHRLDQIHNRKGQLSAVVAAADAVISQIDVEQLASHYGSRVNRDNPAAVLLRTKLDAKREALADTLYRKGRALGYMELPDVIARYPIADPKAHDKAFEENFAELRRWVDTTDRKYVLLHIRRERRKGRYGKALKLLNRFIPTSAPNYWYIKKRRDVYESLGWKHLAEYESRRLMISFPKEYEPF